MAALGQLAFLAHAGSADVDETGQLVFTIMLVSVIAFVWILLGVVCWIFWRAKKREDAERAAKEGAAWPSAPSS